MIYSVSDKKDTSLQSQIEVKKDTVSIYPVDLTDNSNNSLFIEADKADFIKMINAIRFNESDNTGRIKYLKGTIQDLLRKYLFTSQSGEDEMAYNAISMEIIELLEREINTSFPEPDFQVAQMDMELTEAMNKDGK
jgi:hypothetical protein